MLSGVRRMAEFPIQGFCDVVSLELDIGGNQVLNAGVGPAEHNVLPGAFEIIVDNLERTRTVPARNRLRVSADFVYVSDVGIDDGRRGAVERDASPRVVHRIAVNVATID